jgi:hypothetical protein
LEEEVSNAEEQLTSNTINAVNNSLEGWFLPSFFVNYWNSFMAKKTFYDFRFL